MQSEREILLEKVNLAETRCAEADNEVVELRAHVTSKDQTEEALRRQITDLKALVENKRIEKNNKLYLYIDPIKSSKMKKQINFCEDFNLTPHEIFRALNSNTVSFRHSTSSSFLFFYKIFLHLF